MSRAETAATAYVRERLRDAGVINAVLDVRSREVTAPDPEAAMRTSIGVIDAEMPDGLSRNIAAALKSLPGARRIWNSFTHVIVLWAGAE